MTKWRSYTLSLWLYSANLWLNKEPHVVGLLFFRTPAFKKRALECLGLLKSASVKKCARMEFWCQRKIAQKSQILESKKRTMLHFVWTSARKVLILSRKWILKLQQWIPSGSSTRSISTTSFSNFSTMLNPRLKIFLSLVYSKSSLTRNSRWFIINYKGQGKLVGSV